MGSSNKVLPRVVFAPGVSIPTVEDLRALLRLYYRILFFVCEDFAMLVNN